MNYYKSSILQRLQCLYLVSKVTIPSSNISNGNTRALRVYLYRLSTFGLSVFKSRIGILKTNNVVNVRPYKYYISSPKERPLFIINVLCMILERCHISGPFFSCICLLQQIACNKRSWAVKDMDNGRFTIKIGRSSLINKKKKSPNNTLH